MGTNRIVAEQTNKNMKKLFHIIALSASMVVGVSATQYSLADLSAVDFGVGNPYQKTFNLNDAPGFSADPGVIISAFIGLTIIDPANFFGGSEEVTVTLDGTFFAAGSNFASFQPGGAISVSLLADDTLFVEITSSPGSIASRVTMAALQWTTGPGTQPVPDGGSMMALLGLSVLGLGWASRRVRA